LTQRRRLGPVAVFAAVLLGGCAPTPATSPNPGPPPVATPSSPPSSASAINAIGPDPFSVGLGPAPKTKPPAAAPARNDLADARKKDVAMQLLSSAENSSLDWRAQYRYIEDIGDGRGYTGGIVGFCSGTGDMLKVVQHYAKQSPGNVLAKYLPALREVKGGDSHDGLDSAFTADWVAAAGTRAFQQAQDAERDSMYFTPALTAAHQDGLRPLGQFAYFDAAVMHGADSLPALRRRAAAAARPPAQGGDEVIYLNAFLDARVALMKTEPAHRNTTRVDTEQRVFLDQRNLDLTLPLSWKVYGTPYTISR
jgi:chitosanase